ncbi:MAG: glycine cleavage system aminomethyltransferase GcvT [Magnetococcales bacterium]|nr:glycine cleavage system aminomethyltransferase GcvT [Magnetococcales bacterium]
MKKTALYDQHVALNARMTPFSGWDMPLRYGSQIDEHHVVRRECGLFDVSHMARIDITGSGAVSFLQYLLVGDVAVQPVGRALYTLMLNAQGGVVDDLIIYRRDETHFTLINNAGCRDQVVSWLQKWQATQWADSVIMTESTDKVILALQGPKALGCFEKALGENWQGIAERIKPFHFIEQDALMVARTGYTGEDGLEIIAKADQAQALWRSLTEAGATPVGLGARDTLRLEAGLSLYGQDLDSTTSPLSCGVSWTIAWDPVERAFIGREAVQKAREDEQLEKQLGLVLDVRGVLRHGQKILREGKEVGQITSGTFSPTIQKGIALARVAADVTLDDLLMVDMRGRTLPVRAVRLPFVRHGQIKIPDYTS